MPTLKRFAGKPRPRRNCGCVEQPCNCKPGRVGTQGPNLVPTVENCGPGPTADEQLPGNEPVSDEEYRCSLGVRLQGAIDRARRIPHALGFRPYRVFLVWQERERDREWRSVCEMELIPVRLMALDRVDLELSEVGLNPEGAIQLREISPAQVTEDDLRGFLNGEKWGSNTIDRQFFYEVRLHERCTPQDVPGRVFPAGGPRRRRFILGTEPHLDGDRHQFRVGLVDQEIARSRTGRDQTINPDRAKPPALPRLVP